MNRFKNLHIWKRSIALATEIYGVTSKFPPDEKFGLCAQIRRCVVSISSNIAEGAGRNTKKDFNRFLSIAYGSLYELETQLTIAANLDYLNNSEKEILSDEITELQKMVYSFSKTLR